jgi:hypothetical protein
MDCDGLKKIIVSDKDGSYFGAIGTATSDSEWEWNGNPIRGLGDYRIPKEALADSFGNMRNISSVYKYPGTIRDETKCTLMSDWQAWYCNGLDMKQLIIESMDSDTETRRLSPVAIFSNDYKYADLINGPSGIFKFIYV